MIVDQDADFHPRDPSDRTWTETTFLPFFIPEPGIFGNVYVLARPNAGVAISSILISEGLCLQPYEVDYTDAQVHLPCPPSFRKYTLDNGLSVEAVDGPSGYHFSYRSKLGSCEFDLEFKALHKPFDPHDLKENPLAESAAHDPRVGLAWANGHFEAKGRVIGTLKLRGRRFDVDCYEGMDHSWGSRPELGTRSVSWISVNFGPELAMHLAVPLDLEFGLVRYDKIRFGFAVENGQVHALTEAQIDAQRAQMVPTAIRINAKDVRGKQYEIHGSAVAGHPWYSFNPCHVSYQSVMRYRWGNLTGYGEVGDIFGLEYLAQKMSRSARY